MARGYPDWVRLDSLADEPNALLTVAAIGSGYVSAGFEATRWQATMVTFTAGAVAMRLTLEWAVDAAFTVGNVTEVFDVGAGTFLAWTAPNRGSYVRAKIDFAGGGNRTVSLTLTRTNRVTRVPRLFVPPLLLSTGNVNIAAGATTTFALGPGYAGDSDFQIGTNAAAWGYEFIASDYAGAANRIRQVGAVGAASATGRLYLPPMVLTLAITNNDGALRVFNATVVPNLPVS